MARKPVNIIETIRAELERQGMTQTVLAERAGVRLNNLNAWLRGAVIPGADKCDRLLTALGMRIEGPDSF